MCVCCCVLEWVYKGMHIHAASVWFCLCVCVCTLSQVTSLERTAMKLSATGVKAWTITASEHAQWPFDWQPGAVGCVFAWVRGDGRWVESEIMTLMSPIFHALWGEGLTWLLPHTFGTCLLLAVANRCENGFDWQPHSDAHNYIFDFMWIQSSCKKCS